MQSRPRRSGLVTRPTDRSFPRSRRIRKRREFLRIQNRRRGVRTPHFVVLRAPADGGERRLGVTVSRRVGNAVIRNRIKRRVREFFRRYRTLLQPASDFVIVARSGAGELSFQDVAKELATALRVELDGQPADGEPDQRSSEQPPVS